MKLKVFSFVTIFSLAILSISCTINKSNRDFTRHYSLDIRELGERNHGYYFLCYLNSEPQIVPKESIIWHSLPVYLRQYESKLTILELDVKLIDLYFSEYSKKEAVDMWSSLYAGCESEGKEFHHPQKESFLETNKIYFLSCKRNSIKKFTTAYKEKRLLLIDHNYYNVEARYFFVLNAYSPSAVPFDELYSFDDVFQEYLKVISRK